MQVLEVVISVPEQDMFIYYRAQRSHFLALFTDLVV
jgi:hypothetical protein